MAAPCGNKTSRGHACYPLTTYCPNRPATYKRDTTGRPAESAIYKPDTQPKPRPHAYTHAYTGTPARPHPRKSHCPHPPYVHDRARTVKIASHERKGASKAPKTARITPPSAHRQAKPAQLTSREQKGRPPNIKTARNIQNRTPIRSQPMLQHDSGHMRTATTPLRNIRHAHARKHKYTH